MRKVVSVAVVDDHPIFREGVASIFARSAAHKLVAKGASAADAVKIAKDFAPDILLLDIALPGNGLSVLPLLVSIASDTKVVLLTSSETEEHVSEALSQGANGYILKGIGAQQLIDAIGDISEGETYVSPTLAARIFRRMNAKNGVKTYAVDKCALTKREEEILDQVADGHTNKEIARLFALSEKTVKHYMTNIMNKLQVRNRVEAAIFARNRRAAS